MSIHHDFRNAALIATILASTSLTRAQILPVVPNGGQIITIPPVTLNISSNNYSQYQVNLAFTNNYAAARYDVAISSPYYNAVFELGSPTSMSIDISPGAIGGDAPINTLLKSALEANSALLVTYTSHRYGTPDTHHKFAVIYDVNTHKAYALNDNNFSFQYGNIQTTNLEITDFPSRTPRRLTDQTFKFIPR